MTLNTAWPRLFVTPLTVVITESPPALWPKVTTWPETGVPEASNKVTVMVEVDVPLSVTEVGWHSPSRCRPRPGRGR